MLVKFNIKALKRVFSFVAAVALALQVNPEVSKASYYTDDAFRMATSDLSPISSWDFDKSGGSVEDTYDSGIVLHDISYVAPVSMSKQISPDTGEVLTLEAAFSLSNMTDGFSVALKGENSKICEIVTRQMELMLKTDCDAKGLCEYSASSEIGVKLMVDPSEKTVTAMVNGVTYPSLNISAAAVDTIEISTPKKFKVDATINSVKAYSGYSLNEKFIATGAKLPDTWEIVSGKAELVMQKNASMPDVYCIALENGAELKTDFECVESDKARYGFRFFASGNAAFVWKTDSADCITINANGGILSVNGSEKNTYNPSVWQRIDIEIDNTRNKANILQNGKYIAKDIAVSQNSISKFYAQALSSDALIDDVCAYKDKRGEASVTTPVAVQSDAKVGMIRCDIWHEGSHLGWDKILPYEGIHPYLGFYDDGNPDVSDWETKWMVEHGVNFQLNCWFLPRNYEGGVIKEPFGSYGLEDGYFNSRYSDMIDFMIMWENISYPDLSAENFRQYIVPYWIDYYLKDERYLVINNKPVISIYSADNFLSGIGGGDVAKAKENIDYLRNECIKLGYDGAYVLCASVGLADLSNEKAMGFDACHAYTWRDFSGDSKTQINYLTRALENEEGLAVLPTVSVGIDEKPWGKPGGAMLTPEEFSKILRFVKNNEKFDNVAGMGEIMLLDSWNEFGEGHYMMPAGIYGFDYMDAVRGVYTSAETEHTDVVPSDNEKQKLGRMFPQDRQGAPKADFTVPVGKRLYHQWSGNEISSWTPNKYIASMEYDGNVLKATASGTDPSIVSPLLNIDLDDVVQVRLKVKRSCKDSTVQLFYTTEAGEGFSEKKSLKTSGINYNNEWATVTFDVTDNQDFKGNLRLMRLDIINSEGNFEIENVEFLGLNVEYGWSGEELNQWQKNKHISTLEYSDGVLKGVATGDDPSIFIASALEYNIDNIDYIQIKAKRLADDSTLYMFYTTEAGENFTQGKSVYVLAGRSDEWETLLIPVWKIKDFRGTLYKLRFDIINSIGSFEVESIKFIRGNPGDKTQWVVDGETLNPSIPLMRINGELYAEFRQVGTIFGANTAHKADGSEIKIVTKNDVFSICSDGTLLKNESQIGKYSPVCIAADSYAIPLKAVAHIFEYNLIDDADNSKALMTKMELFPLITYDASKDLDEDGLWLYRNLAPDPDCENVNAFWKPTYNNDVGTLSVSDAEYHSGNGSLMKQFKGPYARMGFESDVKANTDYHFSAWMKNETGNDSPNEMVVAGEYTTNDETGKSLGNSQVVITPQLSQRFALTPQWQYINADVRITNFKKNSASYPIGETYTISNQKIYVTKETAGEKVVYMDDLNFRRIPPFNVYTKKVSHADGCEIGNESVKFTFSHDIDPWSVTPDKIMLNGKNGEGLIKTSLNTDETTRETTLSIQFITPPENNEEVTISLFGLKDAWGRNVIGASETAVTGGKIYATAQFSLIGSKLSAEISVKGKEDECLLIVTAGNDKRLEKVQIYKITADNKSGLFEIDMNSEWQELSVFVWKSGDSLLPLCNETTVTKREIEGSTLQQ